MRQVVGWFANLPGADVPLPPPPVWLVVLLYAAAALAWLTRRPRATERRAWPGLVWAVRLPLAVAVVLAFITPIQRDRPAGATAVWLLAVGAGQIAVVETPDGGVTVLDAGSTSLTQPIDAVLAPFLRHRGHRRVDRVMISHANFDHYGGVAEVVERYEPAEVIVGPRFEEDAVGEATGRRLLADLARFDRPPRQAEAGDVVPLGGRTRLVVLWPPADFDGSLRPNDVSLVVRLDHAGLRVLFTADVQPVGLRALLDLAADDPDLLRADVLVAPHHGSVEAETAALLEAVGPKYVISSDDRSLSQKQRDLPDLLGGLPLWRTGRDGTISVLLPADGSGATVDAFGNRRRGSLRYLE
jgi:competence protein ComEC